MYEKPPNSLSFKYSFNKCADDKSPQSPLEPLRSKLGMTRGGTIGTQTTPSPHDKTISGLPVIKPRLIRQMNTFPSTMSQNQPTYFRDNNNYIHSSDDPASNRSLLLQQQTVFPVNPLSPIEYEASLECNCEASSRHHYRSTTRNVHDYGSIHRNINPRQQLYQGETFVLNEKSYFI